MAVGTRFVRFGNKFYAFIDWLTNVMAVISGIFVAAITLLVTVSVVMRYGLRMSVAWSTELVEYFIYGAVMLGIPWVLRNDGHVAVDVVVNALSPGARRWAVFASHVLGAVATAMLFYYAFDATVENFVRGTRAVKVMPVPRWIPFSIIPVVCVPVFFQFVRKIMRAVKPPVE